MKKSFNWIQHNFIKVIALAIITLSFTSCLKDNDDITNLPKAGVMAFNLAPDKAAVGFAISGNNFTNTSIGYTNFTGVYVPVFTGSGSLQAYDYNNNSLVATAPATIVDGKYYSVFLVGKDTTYSNIVVEDKLDSLPAATGKSYVRFINAVADNSNPVVKISSNGTDVVNSSSPYKTVSDFISVNAGSISITISNESATISASRSITVEENKIYTVLLIGKAGTVDPVNAVQIKFITNGTILP